jgi:hypothetical protein
MKPAWKQWPGPVWRTGSGMRELWHERQRVSSVRCQVSGDELRWQGTLVSRLSGMARWEATALGTSLEGGAGCLLFTAYCSLASRSRAIRFAERATTLPGESLSCGRESVSSGGESGRAFCESDGPIGQSDGQIRQSDGSNRQSDGRIGQSDGLIRENDFLIANRGWGQPRP